MKRVTVLILIALGAAVLGYALVGLRPNRAGTASGGMRGTDLTWIRTEFGLSDQQFAEVESLHRSYAVQCSRHCAEILAARETLAEMQRRKVNAADLATAEQRIRELEAVCNEATRAHLRQVAAAMPVEQGRRFLSVVEPHLAQQPHDGVRGLSR